MALNVTPFVPQCQYSVRKKARPCQYESVGTAFVFVLYRLWFVMTVASEQYIIN